MSNIKYAVVLILLNIMLGGCEKIIPPAPADEEILDGPLEDLTPAQHNQFIAGDVAFNDDVFTKDNGLGPVFVATTCGTCHPGDGKGHPFTTLTRFGQTDSTGNQFRHMGGPQLQNRALPGFTPETIPAGATFAKFTPPANTGLGFLDAITDADMLALADPNDADGDGISGVPNWIHPPAYCEERPGTISINGKYMARFGKKAGAYDLLQQTANAYNQDIGITSVFEPRDVYSGAEGEPEISTQKVLDVVAYLKTLKAPIQRNAASAEVVSGKQVFINTGCAKCHTPELKTGSSPIAALDHKTFHPYTDMLLHDMGPELNDGYTEGSALPSEWRTPPLWGLGLSKNSQGGIYYLMHDGRATSINSAIELHGGEAAKARQAYQQLTPADKELLVKFLESL